MFLKKEDADILNLQEVSMGMKKSKSEFFNLYDALQKELGYRYGFYSMQSGSKFAGHNVYLGQLILSKYPITRRSVIYMDAKPQKHSAFSAEAMNVRLLQCARININGKIVNDLNHHGYYMWGSKTGNSRTESHCKKILGYMKSLNQDERIVLSGDFNLAPRSRSLGFINREYTNLVLRYGIKTTRNELSVPQDPVDNIFVNDAVKVKSLKVPKLYVSDHLPLIMEFD
jgi:endonuclease/exonuclease/phosphatase family metal-dependent hydrolase